MQLNGKEIKFKATIKAVIEITDLCPDGDVNKINQLFGKMDAATLKAAVKVITALSCGTLTEEDCLSLDIHELQALLDEAMATFKKDQKPTVEVIVKKDEATEADR